MNEPDTGIIGGDLAAQAVQAFVELAPLPLLIADRTRIWYANVALAATFRCSVPELLNEATPLDLVDSFEREYVGNQLFGPGANRVLQALPAECRRKDDSSFTARLSSWTVTFNGKSLVAITVQETSSLTKESQLAGVLHRTESLAISGACEYDVVTGLLTRSPGLFRILGEPFDGDPVWVEWLIDKVPPEECELVRSMLEGERPGMPYEIEHSIVRRDGNRRTVLHRSVAELDIAGRPYRTVSFLQDITARRAGERRCL